MPASSSPSLSDLQRWMRWVLTFPDGVGSAVSRSPRAGRSGLPRHWTRGGEPRRLLHVIGETPAVSRVTRLSIYGDGYFLRLVGCLAENYPVIAAIVGDHDFRDHLAREYLVRYPSTSRCIDDVGDRLSLFLRGHALTRRFPFLPDLAALEWTYHETFYANEEPRADLGRHAGVAPERWAAARPVVDGSARLLNLRWDVLGLWRDDGRWSAARLRRLKRSPTTFLLFRRPDGQVRVVKIGALEERLLDRFRKGDSIGAALRNVSRLRSATPDAVMMLFRDWVSAGIVRDVRFA